VERTKLQAIVSLQNLDISSDQIAAISLTDALARFGPLQSTDGSNSVTSGATVTLSLANLARGVLEIEPSSGMLHFLGPDQTELYLHTDTSLRRWLERLAGYGLSGVVLEHLLDESIGEQKWALVRAYTELDVPAVDQEDPVWLWTIADVENPGEVVSEDIESLTEMSYRWAVPDRPGEYRIDLALSSGGGTSAIPVASLTEQVVSFSTATPSGSSDRLLPTATPTPIRTTPTRMVTPSRTPTPSPTPTSAPPAPPARAYQLAYTKWDDSFHDLYVADTRSGQTQLVFRHAAGPSWSPDNKRLYFIGEQGVGQQMREDRLACEFGTISDGIVAVDLPSPLRDICQVKSDPWFCERREIDMQAEPSDVCTENGRLPKVM
jgi:hypothetical protein